MPVRRLRLPELAKVKCQDSPSHTVRPSTSLMIPSSSFVFSSYSTGEQPHTCPDCDEYRTADPGSLTRHRKKVHGYVPKPKSKSQSTASKSRRHAPYDRLRGSSLTSESSSSSPASSYYTCNSDAAVFDLSLASTPSSYSYTSASAAPPSDTACSGKVDDMFRPDLLYTYPWDKDFSAQRLVSLEPRFAAPVANSVPCHLITATGSNSQFELDLTAGFFCDSNANAMSMPPPAEAVTDWTWDDELDASLFSQLAAVVPGAGCTTDGVFSNLEYGFDFSEQGSGALQEAGTCALAASWMPNVNAVASSFQPVIDPGLSARFGPSISLDEPTCISPALLTVPSVNGYLAPSQIPTGTDFPLDDLPPLDFSIPLMFNHFISPAPFTAVF